MLATALEIAAAVLDEYSRRPGLYCHIEELD